MNKITLNFDTCSPEPSGGYNVQWRIAGTTGAYTNAGNFFISPAVFYDNENPEGTPYEGYIQTDCGGVLGTPVLWSTAESGESGGGSTAVVINWDYVNQFSPSGGHFRILVNGDSIVDRTATDSGSIVVDIGDAIEVIVQNAVDRSCVIDITGPYIHATAANTYNEDGFTVEAGAYSIHGESL